MKRWTWTWIFVLSVALPVASPALAQAPQLLPLQGYLTDASGEQVDGEHRMTFTLYDDATSGAVLFEDDYRSVDVQQGQFIVYLGSQSSNPLDLAAFASSSQAWIEVVIDGDEIVTPRIQIGSVAYAAVANHCGDADTLEGMGAAAFAPADHTHSTDHTHPTPGVTAATLENSWVAYGADYETASYRRDSDGVVHLSGLVRNGGSQVIFTLPEGMRPAGHHLYPALSYDSGAGAYVIGRIDVNTDGSVVSVSNGDAWVSLDGISFVAAP